MGEATTDGKLGIFTPMQERVRQEILAYKKNVEIALALGKSEHTIREHRKKMAESCRRLGYDVRGHNALLRVLMSMEKDGVLSKPARASELCGYWISKFTFQRLDRTSVAGVPRYLLGTQINLESVEADAGYFSHKGVNVDGVRDDGYERYRHEFRFRVKHRNVVGIWDNGLQTPNAGCFQLFVFDEQIGMLSGNHLGNASNGSVQVGSWLWVKLTNSIRFEPSSSSIRSYAELDSLINKFQSDGVRPSVKDLFK